MLRPELLETEALVNRDLERCDPIFIYDFISFVLILGAESFTNATYADIYPVSSSLAAMGDCD